MVNSRDSLSKISKMNNDANPYIITLDIYKEGYWAYDISNYYKGRVDDNGTPFMVRWYEHGQIKNVHGMRPFIRGTVGQHTIDDKTDPDNPKITPSPDCSQIDQTGETTDTLDGGVAVYRMVNQCFTQEGMFYGEIGLKDSQGTVLSSVDIAFKVLGGRMNMVGARKFYVSEFEKALDNLNAIIEKTKKDFSQELKQVIDDARNAYTNQVKSSQDALLATDAQAKATKEAQADLNQLINDTIQYIKEHNIVTLDKYNDLASQIVKRLSQMNFKPTWYPSQADMVNANPNGTQDICITADTGHKWIYLNGNWTDLGNFAFADIDPKLKESFLSNSDNIIPNPDFEDNALSWSFVNATGNANGSIIISHDMDCKRVASLNAANNESIAFQSDLISVNGQSTLSLKALTRYYHQADSTGTAVIGFDVYDDTGQRLDHVSQGVLVGVNATAINNYKINDLARSIRFYFYLAGEGNFRVGKPHATFTAKTGAYSVQEAEATTVSSDNVLPNSDFKNGAHWQFINITGNANGSIFQDRWADGANVASLNAANGETISLQSAPILTNGNKVLSFKALTRYYHQDDSKGTALIGINFSDANGKQVGRVAYNGIVQGISSAGLSSVAIPENTVSFYFWVYLAGEGNLRIAKPQVTFTTYAGIYSANDALKDPNNALPNPDFLGSNGWQFINITGNANGSIFQDAWAHGANVASLNAANGETISLQSAPILTNGNKVLSFKALTRYYHQDDSKGTASIGVNFFDANGKQVGRVAYNGIAQGQRTPTMNDVLIPENTVSFYFWVYLVGEGNLRIAKPQVTFTSIIGTRDVTEVHDFSSPDNVLPNANFVTQDGWTFTTGVNGATGYIDSYNSVNASNPVVLASNDDKGTISFQSKVIPINGHKIYSVGALTKCSSQGGHALWGIKFLDSNNNLVDKLAISITPSRDYTQSLRENLTFPDKAVSYQVWVFIGSKINVQFLRPQLNYDAKLKPYWGAEQEEIPAIPMMKISVAKDISDNWENGSFLYVNGSHKLEGFLQIGNQGNSSIMFAKKNFKIKLYEDSDCKKKLKLRPKAGWDKNFKFNLKANWVDFTQSRNLMGAKLVADATRVTPIADEKVEQKLGKSQNMGQMEGFPIELYINGEYHGMYTWNTKKDDKTFGMDSDNKAHEIISVGQKSPDHMFFAETGSVIDGTMWEAEIQDQIDPTIQVNFAKFIDWINQSSDADFVKNLHTYIDVKSVINTMLFGIYSNEYDYYCKSLLLATYDQGKTYFMLPYDMDSTWGGEFKGMIKNHSIYDGAFDVRNLNNANYVTNTKTNLLFNRVYKLMLPDIKKQWHYLRRTVWTTEKVCQAYKDFMDAIPNFEYEKDLKRWPDNPSAPDTSYSQIQAFILGRTRLMDNWLELEDDDVNSQLQNLKNQIEQIQHNGTTK